MKSVRVQMLLAACAWTVVVRLAYFIAVRLGIVSELSYYGSLLFVAPAGALCLYGGARVSNRLAGVGLPLAIVLATNLGIGLIMGNFEYYSFFRDQGFVLSSFLLISGLGATLPEKASPLRIAITAFGGELAFYLITNLAFWGLTNTYPHTAEGLLTNYVAALPFFGRAFGGTIVYSAILFATLAWAERPVAEPKRETA